MCIIECVHVEVNDETREDFSCRSLVHSVTVFQFL